MLFCTDLPNRLQICHLHSSESLSWRGSGFQTLVSYLWFAGEHFAAIFGCNQSGLEAVLLKRRVMIPCWVSLKHPTRLDASAQVYLSVPAPLSQICHALLQLPMFLNAKMPPVGLARLESLCSRRPSCSSSPCCDCCGGFYYTENSCSDTGTRSTISSRVIDVQPM